MVPGGNQAGGAAEPKVAQKDGIIRQIITVCKTRLSVAVGDPVERASGQEDFWFLSNTDGQ